jgi:hypothetical protein
MSGTGDSRRWKPPIDAAAKAAFLTALRGGAPRHEAAAAGGYALNSFYRVARSDLAFRAAWDEAHAVSAAAERRGCPSSGSACPSTAFGGPPPPASWGRNSLGRNGEERIVSNNRRIYQRRKMRHVRFDEARQQAFLAHFCWSCDAIAAAAEAGVSESTVYAHRLKDPAFAEEYQSALEQGYVRLEAEALRQRLAAQQRLREAVERAEPGAPPLLAADIAAEFERVMKLLARWDRKARRPDSQASPGGGRRVWTFEVAIALLDKRLKALGLAVPPLPPEVAARYDGPPESGEAEEGGPA